MLWTKCNKWLTSYVSFIHLLSLALCMGIGLKFKHPTLFMEWLFYVVSVSLLSLFFLVRRCSSLEAPQFGFIYPQFCKSLPISGTVCYLDCRHGFKSNGGVDEIRCGKDGKWNKDESSIMKCLGMSRKRHNIIEGVTVIVISDENDTKTVESVFRAHW